MLIAFDYHASGIWQVATKEEMAASSYEEWSALTRSQRQPARAAPHRPLRDLLSDQLLDDLKAWNDSCDFTMVQDDELLDDEVLDERGRALAVRVQNELGTDGWEVFYYMGDRVHRVYPPGIWTEEAWRRDVLGYPPTGRPLIAEP
jgi:hypothetical protein